METDKLIVSNDSVARDTDPTYKEWKRCVTSIRVVISFSTRILPTRNGNLKTPYIPVLTAIYTDPTYKEWKQYQ